MRKKFHIYVTSFMLIFAMIGVTIFTASPASAISNDEITKKALLNALKTCGTTTYLKSTLYPDTFSNEYSWSELGLLFTSKGDSDGTIRLPNLVGNTIKDGDVSCRQVFEGYHAKNQDLKGLTEYPGKRITANNLEKIGYHTSDISSAASLTQECIQITYEYESQKLFGGTEWKTGTTKKYCFWVADGVVKTTTTGDYNVTSSGKNSGRGIGGSLSLNGSYDKNRGTYWMDFYRGYDENGKTKTQIYHSGQVSDQTWSNIKENYTKAASSASKVDGFRNVMLNITQGTGTAPTTPSDSMAGKVLQFSGTKSKDELLHFFAGSSATWDSIKFTEDEKKTLLRAYVQQELDSGAVKYGKCDTLDNTIANQGDKELYVYQKNLGKDSYCVLEGGSEVKKKFNVPRDSMDLLYADSFLTVVTNLLPQEIADKNHEIRNPEETTTGGGDDDGGTVCTTAAGSTAWIVCVITNMLGDAVEGMYEDIEQNYLITNVSFVSTKDEKGKENGTYIAWKEFRNFANGVFAITLVVIIFSQITGFGVNNYGIKKILPSLIIVAVLVNLSFFLCQIAVDLSNIAGTGIKEVFDGINTGSGEDIGFWGDGSIGAIIARVKGFLFSGVVAVGVGSVLVKTAGIWLLPFLLTLLVVAIGVLFFFLLLGLRQVAIIVLITICPIAIVLYALPNTKKLFERWWKMFIGLLIVYPICGLMMGGGKFVSRLTLSALGEKDSSMFFVAIVGSLVQVVPFFLIPTILKSSFKAMGNIGATISNLGRGLGKTTSGKIKKSNAYKDTQERLAGHNAQRTLNRMNKRTGVRGFINNIGAGIRGEGEDGKIKKLSGFRGRVAEFANNSRNRKMNRLNSSILGQQLANRDRSAYFEQGQINAIAGDYDSAWQHDGTFADDEKTGKKLEEALNDLRTNANNNDARARFTAAMRSLNTSDDGRKIVDSVMNKAARDEALAGHTGNAGHQWAANAIRQEKDFGTQYKSKTPGAFSDINYYAAGKAFNGNDFDTIKDGKGNVFHVRKSSRYDKAEKISAEQLMNADDSYRNNIMKGLESGGIREVENGEAKQDNLITQAREIMTNSRLKSEVKGDVARDMDKIANMNYAAPAGSLSSNANANTVDNISKAKMANAGQAELDRIINGIKEGRIQGDDLSGMANVAEATINAANGGSVNLSQESADKLNVIRSFAGRTAIQYIPHDRSATQGINRNGPLPDGVRGVTDSGIAIGGNVNPSTAANAGRQMRRSDNRNNGNGN